MVVKLSLGHREDVEGVKEGCAFFVFGDEVNLPIEPLNNLLADNQA